MSQPPRGTFADLYRAEQEGRTPRPGRPRRRKKRKQVTLYLTPEQEEMLSDLHHSWRKRFKVDRSDIAGLGIELLAAFIVHDTGILEFEDFESLKVRLLEKVRGDNDD